MGITDKIIFCLSAILVTFGIAAFVYLGRQIKKYDEEPIKADLRHMQLVAQIFTSTFLIIMWLVK